MHLPAIIVLAASDSSYCTIAGDFHVWRCRKRNPGSLQLPGSKKLPAIIYLQLSASQIVHGPSPFKKAVRVYEKNKKINVQQLYLVYICMYMHTLKKCRETIALIKVYITIFTP